MVRQCSQWTDHHVLQIDTSQEAIGKILQTLGDPKRLVRKLERVDVQPAPRAPVVSTRSAAPPGPERVSSPFAPAVPAATRETVSESRPLSEAVSSGSDNMLLCDVPEANLILRNTPTVSAPIMVWGARNITELNITQRRPYNEIVQSGTRTTKEHQKGDTAHRNSVFMLYFLLTIACCPTATNPIRDTTALPDAETPRNTRQKAHLSPSAAVDTAAEHLEAFSDDASIVSDASEGCVHHVEHVAMSVGKSVLRQVKQYIQNMSGRPSICFNMRIEHLGTALKCAIPERVPTFWRTS
jgi:hypothetical protein